MKNLELALDAAKEKVFKNSRKAWLLEMKALLRRTISERV